MKTNISENTSRSSVGIIADNMDLYAPPILITIGVTCNTLVMIIMRMRYFNNVSTSLYMCLNAFVDNITLLVAFPVHWFHVSFPELIYRGDNSDFICKITYFIGVSTSNLGIVLTAAMTLERAVAVRWPLKAPRLCTKRKAKYVMIGLTVFVSLKDIHYLIKSKMVSEEILAYLCEIDITSEFFLLYVKRIWPISQNVFLFLSFAVIILSNIIITKSVKKADTYPWNSEISADQRGTSFRGEYNKKSSRTRQLTIMLILDSLTIIICTLPLAIYDIIRPNITDTDVSHLVFSVVFYLVYVNRCANFFLYCITGSRFRQALWTLCTRGHFRRNESIYFMSQNKEFSRATNVQND